MNQYYEVHVTVQPNTNFEAFSEFVKTLDAKPIHIKLNKGEFPDQIMLAASAYLPDDVMALDWAEMYSKIVEERFPVVRTKLEARLTPGNDEYFEAHWKLRGDPRAAEKFIAQNGHFLLSYNLTNSEFYYLSARDYEHDETSASLYFTALGLLLIQSGLPLEKAHRERVIWDSDPTIDNGWASN